MRAASRREADEAGIVPECDFPMLARRIDQQPVVYLDSAATSLKPHAVIDAVTGFYRSGTANIHRGVHTLSREASESHERARDAVARFIGARSREIVFTSGATEAIHCVAEGLALRRDDNVVTSSLDHHSNVVPWLARCEVRFVPEAADGSLQLDRLESLIDGRTRLVALAHASNVTGAVHPIAEAVQIAHRRSVPVLVDAAQSVPHLPTDVQALGADFLAFSGHKMLGPSGIGVLFVREAHWEALRVSRLGGGCVDQVRPDGFALKRFPHRFEAGTPNIEGALGLAAAVDYLEALGMDRVAGHGARLARFMSERFAAIPGLMLLGPRDASRRLPILSLVPSSPRLDPDTLGMLLSDVYKVMVRTGTHCAHPYFQARGLPGSLRLSAYVYTRESDIERAADATAELLHQFGA